MNRRLRYIVVAFIAGLLFCTFDLSAQILCPNRLIYYPGSGGFILGVDPSLPISGSNPVNTGIPNAPHPSLALLPNLNSGLSPTFYCTSGGFYTYWNGTSWVSTGHAAGGVNIGGCGSYIFNMVGAGVSAYNGTTSVPLNMTLPPGCCADLVVDCDCNFYAFCAVMPNQRLLKYDSQGQLLMTYSLTGIPNASGGPGFAILGNDVYWPLGQTWYTATMGSVPTLTFTAVSGFTLPTPGSVGDFASCPYSALSPLSATLSQSGYICLSGQSTANLTASVQGGPVTYTWSGPGIIGSPNGSLVAIGAAGTYTCAITTVSSCPQGVGNFTIAVNAMACISVGSTSITCANLGSATVQATSGVGPFSYTWTPTGQTSSVATGLSPGTYTVTVFDLGNNFTFTATTQFTSLIPLTGNVNHAASVTCNGASTATADVTNIAGGSGTVTYVWQSQVGSIVHTSPTPSLSAGIWSVTVSDVLTGCQIKQTFLVTQPPALNLVMSTSHPTICAGKSATLSAAVSGGTPKLTGTGYTYQWSGGPATYSRSVSQSLAGYYTYSLTAQDSLLCSVQGTVGVDVIPNPTLSVSNVSVCPLATGVLNVTGASTYTWSDNSTNNFLADNPLSNTQYTVIGTAQACTSIATASIILKPTPFAVMNHNAPVCEGKNLNLQGLGGVSYAWSGPLGYTSNAASPVIGSAYPAQSGVYEVTVTAANTCTASAAKTVSIHPTPTISIAGSTVCTNQSLNLYASSFPGTTFSWKGPVFFTSSLQNPVIPTPGTNRTGTYTVQVTSTEGCIGVAGAHASVTALPTPNISSNSPKCFGTTLGLSGTGGETYSWSGPNAFSSSAQNPFLNGVTLAANGVYNLQITLGPCINSTSHTVTIFPLPAFTLQSNSPVCETKTLNLTSQSVSNASSYTWFGPAGFVKPAQNTDRPNSVLVHSGIYTLTVKDQNSCQNSNTISVTIEQNPALKTFGAKVCLNAPATLSVTGASTYQWNGPEFYQSVSPDAFIASAMSTVPRVYTVMGTAANGCTSIATANLETMPLPQPFIKITPSQRLCAGKSFTLEGNGGIYYLWNGPDNLHQNAPALSLTASSSLFSGMYTLTAIDANNCGGITTAKIQVDPLPGGGLWGSKMQSCVPFESQFNYQAKDDEPVLTRWLLNGNEVSVEKHFSGKFTVPGDHIITGILTNTSTGCVNTNTYVVNAYPVPVADFTYKPEKPVEGLDEVQLISTTKGEQQTKWSWYLINDEGPKLEGQNRSHVFEHTGLYPVALVVENKWGCGDTMIKTIRIEPDFNIFVPNVFTPNGDGLNESFLPVMTGVKLYNLKLFNRWGTKLFETSDPQEGWPGEFNGAACKPDVYTWKISLSTHSGEMKTLTGNVLLNR